MSPHRFLVIGIGPGDPELVTVKAIRALNAADIVLVPRKGADKADLAEQRREICRLYLENPATRLVEFDLPRRRSEEDGGYLASVDDWHAAIAATYSGLLAHELPDGGSVALLVWGDPSLYDSTLRILARLTSDHGVKTRIEVVPGVTSIQALTALHGIPLNALGGSVLITTGRRLREGVPDDVDTIVVMLDGEASFRHLTPEGFEIFWGACLGLPDEIALRGRLQDVGPEIAEARERTRSSHGWVMDVYLLRRTGQP
jgi:precorrin-6A synthase